VIVEVSQELEATIIIAGRIASLCHSMETGTYFQRPEREIAKPRIPYRETIRNRYNRIIVTKSNRGAGQFGEVYMQVEPWHEDWPIRKFFRACRDE